MMYNAIQSALRRVSLRKSGTLLTALRPTPDLAKQSDKLCAAGRKLVSVSLVCLEHVTARLISGVELVSP
jgi:hypothetical protein